MKSFHIHPHADHDSTSFSSVLREVLKSRGQIEELDPLKADQIYVLEHPRLFSRDERLLSRSAGERILLRFEPKVVNPILYRKKTEDFYKKIINVGAKNHKGVNDQIIRWPYYVHPNPAKPSRLLEQDSAKIFSGSLKSFHSRRIRISIMVSNKVSWSRDSNYKIRRRIVFNSRGLGVHAFGMGWQTGPVSRIYENLRLFFFFVTQGFIPSFVHVFENLMRPPFLVPGVPDKFLVLLDSQYHIAIENSSTYVSEKIVDALVAGSIPIYLGPSLEGYGIPDDCYIRLRYIPATSAEMEAILSSYDHLDMEMRIRRFVHEEDGLKSWHPQVVAESMVNLCTTN